MRLTTVAAIGLISVSIAATAWSMPGGGGDGATAYTPSRDAPQFDAADEYRKGIEALKAQKFPEAKASFKKVLDVAPTDAATNFLAGMADAGLNDLKSAQKHYEKAVKADKKLVAAHQELGVTYAKLGERDKRCMMEARVAGHQPVAVSHEAGTLEAAINATAEKLERSLDHVLGKLGHKKGRTSFGGDQTV